MQKIKPAISPSLTVRSCARARSAASRSPLRPSIACTGFYIAPLDLLWSGRLFATTRPLTPARLRSRIRKSRFRPKRKSPRSSTSGRAHRQLHALAIWRSAAGPRRGELCALIWADFDAKSGALRIARSLETTEGKGFGSKAQKRETDAGQSSFPCPRSASCKRIGGANKRSGCRRLGRATPDDLIFAMPDGSPLEPDTLSRNWMNNALAATGRAINLHSLRHHHASSLVRAGVDILQSPVAWDTPRRQSP